MVEGNHEDCFGSSRGLRSVIDEAIVVDFGHSCNFSNSISSRAVLKLDEERDVVPDRPVFILKLLEADSSNFDASLARRGSRLGV